MDVMVGEHAASEDTLIVGGSLVVTREQVRAGYWTGEALRQRAENVAAAFQSAVTREIAANGWETP